MKFEAPAAWKSSPPTNPMRRAQLKVEPIEGDDYPAELVVFAFPRRRRHGRGQPRALAEILQGQRRQSPQDREQESPGEERRSHPGGDVRPLLPVAVRRHAKIPTGAGARLLGAIVTGEKTSYYIRMVGPDKTMKKTDGRFRRDAEDDQAGRGVKCSGPSR